MVLQHKKSKISTASQKLDILYNKIPATKGCMENINKNPADGGCCCLVLRPANSAGFIL
jgi:hypothetical protein